MQAVAIKTIRSSLPQNALDESGAAEEYKTAKHRQSHRLGADTTRDPHRDEVLSARRPLRDIVIDAEDENSYRIPRTTPRP